MDFHTRLKAVNRELATFIRHVLDELGAVGGLFAQEATYVHSWGSYGVRLRDFFPDTDIRDP